MITKQTSSACQNQSIGDLPPSVEGYARWSINTGTDGHSFARIVTLRPSSSVMLAYSPWGASRSKIIIGRPPICTATSVVILDLVLSSHSKSKIITGRFQCGPAQSILDLVPPGHSKSKIIERDRADRADQ